MEPKQTGRRSPDPAERQRDAERTKRKLLEAAMTEFAEHGYAGARVGYKVGSNAMIYAKGGYTNAKFDATSTDGTTEFSSDIDTDGYRVGAGVEYAMGSGMYIKGEYRYSNYSEAEVDLPEDAPDTERFDVDLDRHQVVAAVGWRF